MRRFQITIHVLEDDLTFNDRHIVLSGNPRARSSTKAFLNLGNPEAHNSSLNRTATDHMSRCAVTEIERSDGRHGGPPLPNGHKRLSLLLSLRLWHGPHRQRRQRGAHSTTVGKAQRTGIAERSESPQRSVPIRAWSPAVVVVVVRTYGVLRPPPARAATAAARCELGARQARHSPLRLLSIQPRAPPSPLRREPARPGAVFAVAVEVVRRGRVFEQALLLLLRHRQQVPNSRIILLPLIQLWFLTRKMLFKETNLWRNCKG